MPRTMSVAALQTSYGEDMQANIARTIELIREAAGKGAQVILPSELFQGPYFCVSQEERWFGEAHPWRTHPCVPRSSPSRPSSAWRSRSRSSSATARTISTRW